jgi:hypothetical protein
MELYAHLAPGYLRQAIERFAANPGEPEVLAAPLLQALGDGDLSAGGEFHDVGTMRACPGGHRRCAGHAGAEMRAARLPVPTQKDVGNERARSLSW